MKNQSGLGEYRILSYFINPFFSIPSALWLLKRNITIFKLGISTIDNSP